MTTHRLHSVSDAHYEFVLLLHLIDKLHWNQTSIKGFTEVFGSCVQSTSETITLHSGGRGERERKERERVVGRVVGREGQEMGDRTFSCTDIISWLFFHHKPQQTSSHFNITSHHTTPVTSTYKHQTPSPLPLSTPPPSNLSESLTIVNKPDVTDDTKSFPARAVTIVLCAPDTAGPWSAVTMRQISRKRHAYSGSLQQKKVNVDTLTMKMSYALLAVI